MNSGRYIRLGSAVAIWLPPANSYVFKKSNDHLSVPPGKKLKSTSRSSSLKSRNSGGKCMVS